MGMISSSYSEDSDRLGFGLFLAVADLSRLQG